MSETSFEEEDDDLKGIPLAECGKCEEVEGLLYHRLKWYTDSLHYDCTFAVGKENPKIFKCHKIIIASASEALERMLSGNFAEGLKHKDDPIVMDKSVTPETFDLAMRFIYGNVRDFTSCREASRVYSFAHKWQITQLKRAAVEILRESSNMTQIVFAYNFHRHLGDTVEKEYYFKLIKQKTTELLSSPVWKRVSMDFILELFNEPVLGVNSERDLMSALVSWGRAKQVGNASNLREKIDQALKKIRFMAMNPDEFAELCEMYSGVFSLEEKFKIMVSTVLCDPKKMPPGFTTDGHNRKEKKLFDFDFASDNESIELVTEDVMVNRVSQSSSIVFSVDGDYPIYLETVRLDCLMLECNKGKEANLTCSVHSLAKYYSVKPLAHAEFRGNVDLRTTGVMFPRPVLLEKNAWYKISVQYFHEEKLSSKAYSYTSFSSPWTWPGVHESLGLRQHEDQTGHSDINNLEFHYC